MAEQDPTPKKRRVPIGLPITAVLFLFLGLFVAPTLTASFPQEQLNRNALLSGIGFLMVFISIILFYISAIWWLALRLNGKVAYKTYRLIEYILIGGIILGIVGMFQPWLFAAFRYGFYLLLASTVSFIAWSHITPVPEEEAVIRDV
ncbi:MAG: hypothetical protein HS099_14310 [Ardenticatenaceae bacterium]|nr:hypothetical protein [Ardenticatenaceae bacterium]